MPEPKDISPLLDGFTLGSPLSEHHGVTCYPAIKENTNKKYIVKMICVPASQTQFDAMMLAGVYKDPGDAMEYFRENGEDILKEAELLKQLSKLEGFLPYDGWQMEPITRRRLGYEVYLVGSYKRSLDKYIRKNAFTHLEAVNLGLDLCSALSICRQSGYLYVDLKPNNIFVSEKKEYRIGDLGFLRLDALRYASLPERYFSSYTPPELMDAMAPMNLTVDTFAVGMILYQLYNDGHLPFTGVAPLESLPTPCHADYEMAEIIMKAINPDPELRWTDPKELGKAIASYMQKNSINDIPITPFEPLDVNPEDIVPVSAQMDSDSAEETVPESDCEEPSDNSCQTTEPAQESDTCSAEQADAEPTDGEAAEPAEVTEEPEPAEQDAAQSENIPQPTADSDEQHSEEHVPVSEISEEVATIISKADDIIAHEIPEETAFPVLEAQPDPFAFAQEDSEDLDDNVPVDPLMDEPSEVKPPKEKKKAKHFEDPSRKRKIKKFMAGCFTLLILCAFGFAGVWYYQNFFLQTIDSISISGTQDQITVLVDTGIEESRLSVHCTDESGKRLTESVQGGKVIFSGLKPSTQYAIEVDMSGFHKLVGHASDVFTTDATTQVLAFHAIAGSEDGSVMLNFTVDGNDPDFWNIRYTTEGETEKLETITGHSTMITGLTIGKVYTFTLDGGSNFDLGGETSIQYLASRLILAEDMTVTSTNGTDVTVSWETPGDVVVENWNIRFFDGYGFEEELTVTENQVLFTGIDPASKYTFEVTAAGMTQPSSISISADPILLSDFQIEEEQTEMKITWKYTGNAPEGGWLLMYTVDGSGSQLIPCEKASAKISPLIPGANYEFVLQAADNRTIYNNRVTHQTEEAKEFTENKFHAENMTFHLLKTPEDSKWNFESIGDELFTNTFAPSDSASMVMESTADLYQPGTKIQGLFVFRDAYGNILPELTSQVSYNWKTIWDAESTRTGELDLPKLPASPGSYKMELYFNGGFVTEFEITIEE